MKHYHLIYLVTLFFSGCSKAVDSTTQATPSSTNTVTLPAISDVDIGAYRNFVKTTGVRLTDMGVAMQRHLSQNSLTEAQAITCNLFINTLLHEKYLVELAIAAETAHLDAPSAATASLADQSAFALAKIITPFVTLVKTWAQNQGKPMPPDLSAVFKSACQDVGTLLGSVKNRAGSLGTANSKAVVEAISTMDSFFSNLK